MPATYDYDETRAELARALAGLDLARRAAGRTNLPPFMAPDEIRTQIDALDDLIGEVSANLAAARDACTRAGRRGLSVCR